MSSTSAIKFGLKPFALNRPGRSPLNPPTPSLDGGARRVKPSSQNLFPKLVKPGSQDRRHTRRPSQKLSSKASFGRPSVELFSFLVDFLHTPKLIKNLIPQNTAQNLKSRTPDRPKADFLMTFGVHLGIDFHEILDFVKICVNHQNAFKQSISVGSAHPKSYIFSLNFNQNFIYFLMPHSGPHF